MSANQQADEAGDFPISRRMRAALLLALLACVVALVAGFAMRPSARAHRINAATWSQIERRMTIAQVEAIVGHPPGNYAAGAFDKATLINLEGRREAALEQIRANEMDPALTLVYQEWTTDDATLIVWFDEHGIVVDSLYVNFPRSPDGEGFWDSISAWLGRGRREPLMSIDW